MCMINAMASTIKRYLWAAALSFLGMVGICVLIHPSTLATYEYGISEFGAIRATQIPFFVGFVATATFFALVAWRLRADRFLSIVFLLTAFYLIAIAATSYPVNRLWYDLHWCIVIALGFNVLITMARRAKSKSIDKTDYALAAIFIAVTIISFLPILRHIPVLRSFVLREVIGFISSFWFLGRTALRATDNEVSSA